MIHEPGYGPGTEYEVVLPAVEMNDPINLPTVPQWFEEALSDGRIEPIGSHSQDADWMYFKVDTLEGDEYCRADGVIGIDEKGCLYVRQNR